MINEEENNQLNQTNAQPQLNQNTQLNVQPQPNQPNSQPQPNQPNSQPQLNQNIQLSIQPQTNQTSKEQNNTTLSKKEKAIIILAGLLTFLPFDIILSNLLDFTNINLSLGTFTAIKIAIYIPKFIGILIYIFAIKNKTTIKKALPIILIPVLLLNIYLYFKLENMHGGIDYIAEALVMGFFYKGILIVYYVLSVINFIIYSKSFIFKPRTILLLIVPIILIVFGPAFYRIYEENSGKLKDDSKFNTVEDFKQELIKRNLYVNNGLLFGIIRRGEENSQILSFDNNEKSYPSYIYYGYKSKTTNNDYTWIIYYTNGYIYANLSTSKSHDAIGNLFLESNEIYVYDIYDNKYRMIKTDEKDKCIEGNSERFENNEEETIYIDYMHINEFAEHIKNLDLCAKYETVNYINNTILDKYAKDFTYKGYGRYGR